MKNLRPIILGLAFVGAMILVYQGLRADGVYGLSLMLVGLGIILFELYLYNKQYQ